MGTGILACAAPALPVTCAPTTPPKPLGQLAAMMLKPGGLFILGPAMRYEKPALTLGEQG